MGRKKEFSNEEKDLLLKMYNENTSLKTMQEYFRCNQRRIKRFFDENVKLRDNINKGKTMNMLSHDVFVQKLKKVTEDIVPVDQYRGRGKSIRFECKNCGHIWSNQPGNILNGQQCPQCTGRIPYTLETFKEKMKNINSDIDVIGPFNGVINEVKCRCKKCNNIWYPLATGILRGGRCPVCNESKGEALIRKYLLDNNIVFIPQHTFDDCRRSRCLPFDFYLPDYDVLIEYDGQQHFASIDIFGGQDRFVYQQENDEIKNKYCKDHNIKLLRIAFYDIDNINDILKQNLTIQNDYKGEENYGKTEC